MSSSNGTEEAIVSPTESNTPVIEPPPPEKGHKHSSSSSSLHNAQGWDGKLRVEKKAVLVNPEVLDANYRSDPEESDDDAVPVDQIEADEGELLQAFGRTSTHS
jgi:protein phosphatase 1 regulatory subunit 7